MLDLNSLSTKALSIGTNVVLAIIVLLVGRFVIGLIVKGAGKAMKSRNLDASLQPFLLGLLSAILKVALVISVMGMVGIKTTSFIAILGAAGLAVGMALQGTLGNFAGSVLILIFKPFKVGDVVEAQGYVGSVSEIGIFCSTLKTPDNKTIILPNGPLSASSLINYSTEELRRVDWTFGIAYSDDLKVAQANLLKILSEDTRILQEKGNFARVSELADSSVNFAVRAWVNAKDYWDVYFDVIEKVKIDFDANSLNFPFPQSEVHLISQDTKH